MRRRSKKTARRVSFVERIACRKLLQINDLLARSQALDHLDIPSAEFTA
jgi:hypothetical protein